METKCFWNICSLPLFIFLLSEEALHAQARMCYSESKTFDAKPCKVGDEVSLPDGMLPVPPPESMFPNLPSLPQWMEHPSGEREREKNSLTSSAKGMVFPLSPPDDDPDTETLRPAASANNPKGITLRPAAPAKHPKRITLRPAASAKHPKGMVFPLSPPDDPDTETLRPAASAKHPMGMVFPLSPPDDADPEALRPASSAKHPKGMVFPLSPPDDPDTETLRPAASAKHPEDP